jgi:hypothetical protein
VLSGGIPFNIRIPADDTNPGARCIQQNAIKFPIFHQIDMLQVTDLTSNDFNAQSAYFMIQSSYFG